VIIVLPKLVSRERSIDRIATILSGLSLERAWQVKVEPYASKRTNQQNKYLWGVVYPNILSSGKLEGWTAEEVHDYCLGEHFGWETVEGLGRKRIRPIKRSAKLTTPEFQDFIAFIQQRMAEHGIFIPDPDQEFA
jgi:hypothetical protein